MRFLFGKNWKNYLKHNFNEKTVERSVNSLNDFLGPDVMAGKSFLDVGCGSGVHSLAAIKLGASKVVSIDIDKDSVKCCQWVKDKKGHGYDWQVIEGSMLDESFMRGLGQFDIVYCWGVAHHTGDMWKALENLWGNIKSGGMMFLAIYNKTDGLFGSAMWWRIKKFYNSSNFVVKKNMEWGYISWHYLSLVTHLKNPSAFSRNFKNKRGMEFKTDLIDWLGGYPYEYATAQEIFKFYHDKFGADLVNIKTNNSLGNNQFLFRKRSPDDR